MQKIQRRRKGLFLLIPEYNCLDKITENWGLFSKGGKSIILQVFHFFYFLTPEKFLVIGVSSPGSFIRCLCLAVIPRAWIVGTERNRVDTGMGSNPHDKFTFSTSSVKERDSVTIFYFFFFSLTVLLIPQTVNYLPSHFPLESPSVSQIPSIFSQVVLLIQI